MPKSAKEEWVRQIGLMTEMGLSVSGLHRTTLTNYCICHWLIEKATEEIERDGATIQNPMGGLCRHPASVTLCQALGHARAYAVELGWTPGSTGKIPKPVPDGKKSKFEGL